MTHTEHQNLVANVIYEIGRTVEAAECNLLSPHLTYYDDQIILSEGGDPLIKILTCSELGVDRVVEVGDLDKIERTFTDRHYYYIAVSWKRNYTWLVGEVRNIVKKLNDAQITAVEGEEESRRNGMVTHALNCKACSGCEYADAHTGGWCHQYVDAPDLLPCDKFKSNQKA